MTNNQMRESFKSGPPLLGLIGPEDAIAPSPRKKRILVVDDEPGVTRLLKLNLEQTNEYEVRAQIGSSGAIAAAEGFQPDLILLDVLMPGMDGGELAALLLENPKLKSVPIVFLTALATKTDVHRGAGRIGGLPFLAKPVNVDDVLRCLKQYLG